MDHKHMIGVVERYMDAFNDKDIRNEEKDEQKMEKEEIENKEKDKT